MAKSGRQAIQHMRLQRDTVLQTHSYWTHTHTHTHSRRKSAHIGGSSRMTFSRSKVVSLNITPCTGAWESVPVALWVCLPAGVCLQVCAGVPAPGQGPFMSPQLTRQPVNRAYSTPSISLWNILTIYSKFWLLFRLVCPNQLHNFFGIQQFFNDNQKCYKAIMFVCHLLALFFCLYAM